MTLENRLRDLITAVGTDYKQLRSWLTGSSSGNLTALGTADKSSIVAAINEVNGKAVPPPPHADANTAGIVQLASLVEAAAGLDATKAMTPAAVRQERAALKNEILGGVGPMADTLQELYDLANAAEETAAINSLVTTVGQKADKTDVYTKAEIGNPEADLVAAYSAAKA